jgi:SpoVK/Ycf46/Vps4 family AAA+-type ATPase
MNVGPLKTILDGNHSMDNCLVFATTNYIDKIPDALKKDHLDSSTY